jgi:hypothetical protein
MDPSLSVRPDRHPSRLCDLQFECSEALEQPGTKFSGKDSMASIHRMVTELWFNLARAAMSVATPLALKSARLRPVLIRDQTCLC